MRKKHEKLVIDNEASDDSDDDSAESIQRTSTRDYVNRHSIFALRRTVTCLIVSLLITTVMMVFFIIAWTEVKKSNNNSDNNSQPSNSNSNSNLNIDICTSQSCVEIAGELLSRMDTNIDPCDDFYLYSCGNWIKDHDYKLLEEESWNTLSETQDYLNNYVLDTLFYHINQSVVNHSSILKAKYFYQSCYDYSSDSSSSGSINNNGDGSLKDSKLFTTFIENINFTGTFYDDWELWTKDELNRGWYDRINLTQNGVEYDNKLVYEAFIDTFAWLGQRGWNPMIVFDGYTDNAYGYLPVLAQNYDIWYNYDAIRFELVVNDTHIPFYQSYFGMSKEDAIIIGAKVSQFSDKLANISTVTWKYSVENDFEHDNIDNVDCYTYNELIDEDKVAQSRILNFTQILLKTFDVSLNLFNGNEDTKEIVLFDEFFDYWENLKLLLETADPVTVQFYLFTQVLTFNMDYESSHEQSQLQSRADYCMSSFRKSFIWVYGYAVNHGLFDKESQQEVSEMMDKIIDELELLFNQSEWLINCTLEVINDDGIDVETQCQSYNKTINRLRSISRFIGAPPDLNNHTALDIYYDGLEINVSNKQAIQETIGDFWGNLYKLAMFDAHIISNIIKGDVKDVARPWNGYGYLWPTRLQDGILFAVNPLYTGYCMLHKFMCNYNLTFVFFSCVYMCYDVVLM